MPRKPTVNSGGCPKNPVGRPEKHIDWELFEKLCGIQCTQSEMASMLKVNVDTLHDKAVQHYGVNFSETYKRFTESGKCSIRRYQFSHMPKNASMCMYLGKVYLGQKETPDNLSAPNDQANELISAYQKQLAEAWKENEHLKSNGNVSQTANQQT